MDAEAATIFWLFRVPRLRLGPTVDRASSTGHRGGHGAQAKESGEGRAVVAQTDTDWDRVIRGLREGDDGIVEEFCRQYGPALERLAQKNLQPQLRRRFDPEDAVQSAFRTFFRRAAGGQFRLPDSESLWRLICAITLTKVRERARLELRQKRTPQREVPIDTSPTESTGPTQSPADGGPTPVEMAQFSEFFEQLLVSLDEEERKVVELKLQDFTQLEVAERLGSSERTVRRILKRIEARLAPP